MQKISPNDRQKLNGRRKIKEGYLFSLNDIKKIKRNLGTEESFPVFPFLCLSVFSQVHSCGSVCDVIPDLIEIGVDILNPVQVSAVKMDTAKLKKGVW